MRTAFAVWNERIAPVFDVARQIRLVQAESGRVVNSMDTSLPDDQGTGKGIRLAELGVHTLICGAISRSTHSLVESHGIRVIPFVSGDFQKVVQAWLDGDLKEESFSMPGCCGRRGRRRVRARDRRRIDHAWRR